MKERELRASEGWRYRHCRHRRVILMTREDSTPSEEAAHAIWDSGHDIQQQLPIVPHHAQVISLLKLGRYQHLVGPSEGHVKVKVRVRRRINKALRTDSAVTDRHTDIRQVEEVLASMILNVTAVLMIPNCAS